MKKICLLFCVLLITGCSSLKCSYQNNYSDTYVMSVKNKYTFKKNVVKKAYIKQEIKYNKDALIKYNININDVKTSYENVFKTSFASISGLNYKIKLRKNKLSLIIHCQNDCLNAYLKIENKTKDDILKIYENSYKCSF